MNRAGGRELARVKVECLHVDHSHIKIDIRLQEFSHRLRRDIATTRERDVRMPRTQIRVEANGEGRVAHPLVQLKKVRMPVTDADPDNLGCAFRRECSDAGYRQKKSAEMNRAEFFAEFCIDIFRHVTKETEREMYLFGGDPPDTANLWIEIDKKLSNCLGQIDRDEEALCFHSSPQTSAPVRAWSPL